MPITDEARKKCKESLRKKLYENAATQIGKTYGWLTIKNIDYEMTEQKNCNDKHYGAYVVCECRCGNVKSYRLNSLKTGHTYSCGCSKFNNPKREEDLTGKKIWKINCD